MSKPLNLDPVAALAQMPVLLREIGEHKAAGRYLEAGQALVRGYGLFGLERRRLQMLEPTAVLRAVQSPDELRAVVELLAQEADLLRLEGDKDSAASMARWTLSVMLHGAPDGDYSEITHALLGIAESNMVQASAGFGSPSQ